MARIPSDQLKALQDRLGIKPKRRRPRELEHAEQVALFRWATYNTVRWPELGLLFAIPNGGHRSKATAGKLKAEGVKAGVPDLLLPVARRQWHGLFIELKAEGGRLSDKQRDWLALLTKQGYLVMTCYGWEAAKTTLEDYLTD